jgi:hypothetical protein
MAFRLKALGLHLGASLVALALILATFFLCWYRWPGWYLADATQVIRVLVGVDLMAGPLLTFIVAVKSKSRRELARDVTVIIVLQLIALGYGCMSLWNGRPLYYAFSEDVLQVIQAYDIDPNEAAIAVQQNAPLVPHWYSLPRWIWAPLPEDAKEHDRIVASAINGGGDVISMPRYYRPWTAGLPTLRTQLQKVDDIKYFSPVEKAFLTARLRAAGIAAGKSNSIAMTGRGRPLLAVFDPATLNLTTIIKAH